MIKIVDNNTNTNTESIDVQPIDIIKDVDNDYLFISDAIKREIHIKFNNNGRPNLSKIPLGVQWDHRVTWLSFDFDDLIWNTESKDDDDYTEETKYDKYIFKIFFKLEDNDTLIFMLDPYEAFEVPRKVTRNAGNYQIAIGIEEDLTQSADGNVPDKTEIYMTETITGTVEESWFDPRVLINYFDGDTYQRKALVKKWIDGTLNDYGIFRLNSKFLGVRADSYIKYIRFNHNKITAHLDEFQIFAAFYNAETREMYFSKFEKADPEDGYDHYEEGYPIIAWVPDEITKNESVWDLAIIAYAGLLEDIRHNLVLNPDQYCFYVSNSINGCIVKGFVSQEDIDKYIKYTYNAQLVTSEDEPVQDSNDFDVYTTEHGGGH